MSKAHHRQAAAVGEPSTRAILIAGPTASGKSALAIDLARTFDGVVVNADSMQVYRELRILTARPTEAEEREVPHRLYGHVSGRTPYSTGHWLGDVARVLDEVRGLHKRAIIVGGTGLYFKALLEGLSPMPAIPEATRRRWREEAARIGPAALYEILKDRDPEMARRLRPSDPQRMTRALEVLDATGRSLAEWQMSPGEPVLKPGGSLNLLLMPARDILNQRSEARFDHMMDHGALQEVAALRQLGLPPERPILKALGVQPLLDHIEGRLTLQDAVSLAKAQTRDYIKRQLTWMRSNMRSWNVLDAQFYNEIRSGATNFVLATIDQP